MIVAVTGGKGGIGVSTVAFNLGAALDAPVVDADLTMADLPSARQPTVHDVLAGLADPTDAVRDERSPVLMPGGRSLIGARASDPRALSDLVETVASAAGTVVIDTPAGCGPGAGLALQAADAYVLVTTAEPVAVADAVWVRTLARKLEAGLVCLAVNRASPDAPVGAIETFLGGPAVPIPSSSAVAAAMEEGVPVERLAADTTAVDRFAAIAQRVHNSRSS